MTDLLDRDARMLAVRALDLDDPLTEHAARYGIAQLLVRSQLPRVCASVWASRSGKGVHVQFMHDLTVHLAEFISDKCFNRGTSSELDLKMIAEGSSTCAWARYLLISRCSLTGPRMWRSWLRATGENEHVESGGYEGDYDAVLTALSPHGATFESIERGLDVLESAPNRMLSGGSVELHRRAAALRAGFRLPATNPVRFRGEMLSALSDNPRSAQIVVLDMLAGLPVEPEIREALTGWSKDALEILASDPRITEVILKAAGTPEPLLPTELLNKVLDRASVLAENAGHSKTGRVAMALRRIVKAWAKARSEWTARERSYWKGVDRKSDQQRSEDMSAFRETVEASVAAGASHLGVSPEAVWLCLESILAEVDCPRLAG